MLRARQQRRRDAKKIFLGLLAEGRLNEIKISSLIFTEKFHRSKKLNQRSFFCVDQREKKSVSREDAKLFLRLYVKILILFFTRCLIRPGGDFFPDQFPHLLALLATFFDGSHVMNPSIKTADGSF